MRTTVDAVAEFLAVAGIRRMYGVPGAGSAPLQLDIAGVKVANAQFTWRDEKSGSTTALSNPEDYQSPAPPSPPPKATRR